MILFNEDLSYLCNTTHTKKTSCGNAGNSHHLLMFPSMPLALYWFYCVLLRQEQVPSDLQAQRGCLLLRSCI